MPLLRQQDTFQAQDNGYKSKSTMNYSATINVGGNAEELLECFSPEGIDKERSKYTIKKTKEGVVFEITAKDAVALRATVNMITQMLAVHQKMGLK